MKIISITQADWCNVGYAIAKALRLVGVDAESFKMSPHNFGYAEESKILSTELLRYEINKADIVFICNSNYFCLELCKQANKKNVYVYHTGTNYRRKPKEYNEKFNPFIKRAFTDQTEFIGTGMKNEHYVFSPIDTEKITCEIKKPASCLKIAHYPSNSVVKGTTIIRNVLQNLEMVHSGKIQFAISATTVPHEKQIERMKDCDVYVELFAPEHEGNKYGCFGVTAMEAAALGKIVVTNHTTPEVYERFYGKKTPFIIPQTERELFQSIENLILAGRQELTEKKIQTRQWADSYHGYKATGERLKQLLEIV